MNQKNRAFILSKNQNKKKTYLLFLLKNPGKRNPSKKNKDMSKNALRVFIKHVCVRSPKKQKKEKETIYFHFLFNLLLFQFSHLFENFNEIDIQN